MKIEDAKGVAILGRQPKIGLAELESLYGAESVAPFGEHAALSTVDACEVAFDRLGGSIRYGTILLELPSTNWGQIEKLLIENAPAKAAQVEGKLKFGISVFGFDISPKKVSKTALLLKKAIKESGKSVRMVPHKDLQLNSAVVLNNKLAGNPLAWELLIIKSGDKAILAQTTNIQDIDKYAERDQARPKRDAKVGMLPPKLAQIIVNLAVGKINRLRIEDEGLDKNESPDTKTNGERAKIGAAASSTVSGMCDTAHEQRKQQADMSRSPLILDPFCGTGVLLQEAMLMDYDIYGSDIEPRMIEYTIDNLKWLDGLYPDVGDYRRIEVGDATKHTWEFKDDSKLVVAAETFLGHPLSTLPNGEHLSKIIYEANVINHRFLQNIAGQLESGTRLCLAVPAWRGKHEFLHLPLLDHLTEMGYTRLRFTHASNEDLIYHRKDQIVARELLVLIKN